MNKNFYYFHWKEDDGGIAYSPKDSNVEFIDELDNFDRVPFVFSLKEGPFQDYLSSNLGWPIFSEKFKNIIEPYLSRVSFRWIPATVADINGKKYTVFVLRFYDTLDVLNKEKTIFVDDSIDDLVVKAVLSKEKVKDLDVFIIPGSEFRIIVSENVKSKIEENNITGIDFSKVPIA